MGIVPAEQDYPEAAPPDNDLQPIMEEGQHEEIVSMVDDIHTKSVQSNKAGSDVGIPVKLGTSLQKSLSKRSSEGRHFPKNENEAESRHDEISMSTSLTSLQKSILAEQHQSLINRTLEKKRDENTLTQRDALLLEWESFLYRKLTEKPESTLNTGPRGQIRLFDPISHRPDACSHWKRPNRDNKDVTASEAAEMVKSAGLPLLDRTMGLTELWG